MSMEHVEEQLNVWGWVPSKHWDVFVGNYHLAFNPRTMVMTWITMILVAIFAIAATRNMSMRKPTGAQNMLEMAWDTIRGMVHENMDPKKGASLLSIVITYFIFILFSNLLGLIPTFNSPTADYNTTLALSLCTLFLTYFYGFKYRGIGYLKHYIEPYWWFVPFVIVEDFSKPITLTFRLYGNIYAGELLMVVLLSLLGGWAHVFGGFIASVVWLAFSVFVGLIQAYIFTILSITFISQSVAAHH